MLIDKNNKKKAYNNLVQAIKKCNKCKHIGDRSHNPNHVIGKGSIDAKIMIIGEAPGFVEDCLEIPFCSNEDLIISKCPECLKYRDCMTYFINGQQSKYGHIKCNGFVKETNVKKIDKNREIKKIKTGGQYVNDIIKSFGVTESEFYMTNVIMCRPFMNRSPQEEEINNCSDYVAMLIAIIKPEYVITLGSYAFKSITLKNGGLSKSIGKKYKIQLSSLINVEEDHEFIVVPSWHPAYLLRNRKNKELHRKLSWDMYDAFKYVLLKTNSINKEDMQKRPDKYEKKIDPPKRQRIKAYNLGDIERYIGDEIKTNKRCILSEEINKKYDNINLEENSIILNDTHITYFNNKVFD